MGLNYGDGRRSPAMHVNAWVFGILWNSLPLEASDTSPQGGAIRMAWKFQVPRRKKAVVQTPLGCTGLWLFYLSRHAKILRLACGRGGLGNPL